MLKRSVLIALLLALALALTGCRTVQGIGRDITWLGEKTEDALR